jgi:putative transposase
MARLKRFAAPGHPHYVLQRAASGGSAFFDDEDHLRYLDLLAVLSREYAVDIHAYLLLPYAVHLLATPHGAHALSRLIQGLGRRYVPGFNRKHARAGSPWQGRFTSAPVEASTAFIDCMRYLEQAPVRERLVGAAEDYRWSSAARHIGHSPSDDMLVDHAAYWHLGNTPFEREAAYRRLLAEPIAGGEAQRLSAALAGWPVGTSSFLSQIALQSGRRTVQKIAGRPRRAIDVSPNKSDR